MNNKYPYFKMRLWDKVAKRMFAPLDENEDYDSLTKKRRNETIFGSQYRLYNNGSISHDGVWCSSDIVPMLWTTFCDKNKNDIYDGDILKSPHPDATVMWEVFFDHGFWLARERPLNKERDFNDGLGLFAMANDLVVIGNIYQNPELLEEKDVEC